MSVSWRPEAHDVQWLGQAEESVDDVGGRSGGTPENRAREQDVRFIAGNPGGIRVMRAEELDDVDHSMVRTGSDQRDHEAGGVTAPPEAKTHVPHGDQALVDLGHPGWNSIHVVRPPPLAPTRAMAGTRPSRC